MNKDVILGEHSDHNAGFSDFHQMWQRNEASLWVSLCLAVIVVVFPAQTHAETLSGHAYAADGDTLEIRGKRIRLYGIDAFEHGQICGRIACGSSARRALSDLTQGRLVACARQDTDRYGRIVAICRLPDGRDLGQELIRQGWAVAYRRFSTRYLADEKIARRSRAGAWAQSFQTPSAYRKAHPRN